jgi:hypothetical protein
MRAPAETTKEERFTNIPSFAKTRRMGHSELFDGSKAGITGRRQGSGGL